MPTPWSDIEDLNARWNRVVGPDVAPLGSGLRRALFDRWIRLHTLPGGERIASSAGQRQEVLRRYRTVLGALGTPELVSTCGWEGAGRRPADLAALLPAARWLQTGDAVVYASRLSGADGGLLDDLLMEWVADDRTADVILAPSGLDWLVHPYDGGIDVIARDSQHRDELRVRFAQWTSPRDDGL